MEKNSYELRAYESVGDGRDLNNNVLLLFIINFLIIIIIIKVLTKQLVDIM